MKLPNIRVLYTKLCIDCNKDAINEFIDNNIHLLIQWSPWLMPHYLLTKFFCENFHWCSCKHIRKNEFSHKILSTIPCFLRRFVKLRCKMRDINEKSTSECTHYRGISSIDYFYNPWNTTARTCPAFEVLRDFILHLSIQSFFQQA